MKLIRVGVDLAKNVFQVHGVDRNEKAVWRRKLTRESWLKVLREAVRWRKPFKPMRRSVMRRQFTRARRCGVLTRFCEQD